MRRTLAVALALSLTWEASAQVLPTSPLPIESGPALPEIPLEAQETPTLDFTAPAETFGPLSQAPLSTLDAAQPVSMPISRVSARTAERRALSAAEFRHSIKLPAENAKIEFDARWDRSRVGPGALDLAGLPAAPLLSAPRRAAARAAKLLLAPASVAGSAFAGAAAAGVLGLPWLQRTALGRPVSTWLVVAGLAVGSGVAARGVRAVVERLLRRSKKDPLVKSFLVSASGYAVYVLAAGSIAHALGVDLPTLLGSLGVTTLAASFALKGPFGNVAGIISILIDRPFRIGEKIQIGASAAYRGVVQGVSLARTRLAAADGSMIDVPNSMFIENAILKLEPPPNEALPSVEARKGSPWWAWPAAAALPATWLALRLWKGPPTAWLGMLAIAGLSWLAARAVGALASRLLRRSAKDPLLKNLVASGSAAAVYLAAGVVIAHMLGVNLVGLMGSLSVTSMAVGYILRAPLSNIVGGITILERQPRSFSEGDTIQIGSDATLTGKVERIALTRTVLRSGETQLWVPNLMFIETPVTRKSPPRS